MLDYNTAVVLVGVTALAVTSGVVGTFLVLRRRALAGDALAHASLPGLVGAFLLFERRELYLLLSGALISGLLGITVIAALRRYTRIKEDAAIGIVLSVFFGAGIVLSRFAQNRTTAGSKAGLDSFLLGKTAGMIYQDALIIVVISVATIAIIFVLFKELKLVTFDPGFAVAQGWPTLGIDLLILSLVAVNVMIGLPAVGVVLMAALLILPAVAARFWTERLGTMILLAASFGAIVGIAGTFLSASFDRFPAGPVIILTGSVILGFSMLIAPRRGLIVQFIRERRFRKEIESRALLEEIYEFAEQGSWPTQEEVLHRSGERAALRRLTYQGYVRENENGSLELTTRGMNRAESIVLGSRLWKMFLDIHPDLGGSLVDLSHESVDEILPAETVKELNDLVRAQGLWPSLGTH